MAHIIGFVSGGVLYASTGATAAEALDELCEEYGEEMAVRYAEGLRDLSPRTGAPAVPDGAVPGGAPDEGVETQLPAPRPETDAVAQRNTGAVEPSPPAQPGADTATEACGICGGPVPPDWASVAKELHGDVRCLGCTA